METDVDDGRWDDPFTTFENMYGSGFVGVTDLASKAPADAVAVAVYEQDEDEDVAPIRVLAVLVLADDGQEWLSAEAYLTLEAAQQLRGFLDAAIGRLSSSAVSQS